MASWKERVKKHHEWAHQDDGYHLVTRPSVSLVQIKEVETALGFQFPKEVREFYLEVDGFGVKHEGREEVDWFVVPLDKVEETTKQARDWFQETHPYAAKGFFAFIDWSCGDYTGYLVSEAPREEVFVTFSHELYEFNPEQDPNEFIEVSYDSFEEMLDEQARP